MEMVFCVDAGGTKTRGALFSETGQELGRAIGGGAALSLGVAQSAEHIRGVWQMVARSAGIEAHQTGFISLIAGIAGCGLPGRAEALAAQLAEFASITIVPDGLGMLMSARAAGFGGVVSVGTGIAALGLTHAGEVKAISGWGFPAGDRGSGAWLGCQAVGVLFDYLDAVPNPSPLSADVAGRLVARLGGEVSKMQSWQMTASAADFAGLVPLIVEGARAGDAACERLLIGAAEHVAGLGAALDAALDAALGELGQMGADAPEGDGGPLRLALSGGLAATLLPYCQRVAGQFDWQTPGVEPVSGLYALARGGETPKFLPRPGFSVFAP